jgi:ATP-binding protein involved in chromosome partitioning
MIDPRLEVIGKRLEPVQRIIPVSSAKGGVGKSVCAALLARDFARRGIRTGLLDLDFQGASAHLLLDVHLDFPEEESGIKPLRTGNLDFMSFAPFSREHAVPLRGSEVSQAMLELMAITIWDPIDILLIDMPPGIGDEIFDVLRYLPNPEFLVVTTPSSLVRHVVERLLAMLSQMKVPIIGVIENMARSGADSPAAALAGQYGTALLGSIPFTEGIEQLPAASAGSVTVPQALAESIRSISTRIAPGQD